MKSPLFQIETTPTREEILVKKFSENCESYPITQCYKNKLLLNCGYSKEVEELILEIVNKFFESEELPWWLELID